MKEYNLKVDKSEAGKRVDKFLASQFDDFSRNYIQKLIEDSKIKVNSNPVQNSYLIKEADEIKVIIDKAKKSSIKAVDIELDIIYEDQDIIIINKDADMVVHPAPGHYDDTIVNALLAYTNDLSAINGVKRPGIVHRLDKDTSGLLLVAKNDKSHKELSRQFKKGK